MEFLSRREDQGGRSERQTVLERFECDGMGRRVPNIADVLSEPKLNT